MWVTGDYFLRYRAHSERSPTLRANPGRLRESWKTNCRDTTKGEAVPRLDRELQRPGTVSAMGVIEKVASEGRDELTEDESKEYLESEVRRYLDMPLEKFYKLAEQGRLPDHPAVAHLILLTGARPSSC